MNLVSMFAATVEKFPEKTFIIDGRRRWSYGSINLEANKIAHTLIQMGVKKGDRIAVMLPNRQEFVSVLFGILKAGGVAVALDTRYRIGELANVFANCKPTLIIGESTLLEPVVSELSQFNYVKGIITLGKEQSKYSVNFTTYDGIMATVPGKLNEVNNRAEDLAIISYSGGPTHRPKGVMLSHESLAAEAMIAARGFAQSERDILMLFCLPMYHNFALCSALLSSVWMGSTIVIVPGSGISIHTLLETVGNEKGTMWLGVPYIFALAVKLAEKEGNKFDLRSLRLCVSGGAPLSPDLVKDFRKYYGLNLCDVWGLTESSSHVTCTTLNGSGTLGTIGRALAGWELKIVGDAGMELGNGEVGEIVVRGPIMNGYYHDSEATKRVLKKGWLYTGDLGKSDRDGEITFCGVKKEIIILKGQNIYPQDIEATISIHPKVMAVKVIGVPDKLRGEVVGAAVVLKPGQAASEVEIKQYCAERIADYKVPRRVVFVAFLPDRSNSQQNWKRLREQLLPLFMPTAE